MRDLKVRVERVVRPIRAGGRRKMKMREELLAHLTASYQDGLAEGLKEDIAIRRALERFGDPAALRAELQASVPAVERVLYFTFPFHKQLRDSSLGLWIRRSGESAAHHAWRLSLVFAAFLVGMHAIIFLVCQLAYGTGSVPFHARLCAAFQAVPFAFVFIYVLFLDEVQDVLRKVGSFLRRGTIIGALYLLLAALTGAACLSVRLLAGNRLHGKGTQLLWFFVGACVLVPAMLVYPAVALQAYRKRREEWDNLILDD